ncbi:MAG TPA: hypothetical protein VNN18_01075 [Candidatus Xenobia bacterium]|nr:hypothetical protein [Candidatus Xenobia bacterium]
MKYKYLFANGHARSVYVLWPSSAAEFSRGRRVFSKPVEVSGDEWKGLAVEAITAQLFYVELGSGQVCGEDTGGILARKRASFWQGTAEKRRLLTLYREQGGTALMEALSESQQPGEDPASSAVRQAMLRAYQRKGLPEVLALLEKPAEASVPLVFLRSKE